MTHDPRCTSVNENRTGLNGCNCWVYAKQPTHIRDIIPTVMEKVKMPQTELAARGTLVDRLRDLPADYLSIASTIDASASGIHLAAPALRPDGTRNPPVTGQQAALASELRQKVALLRAYLWDRHAETIKKADQVHKALTAERNGDVAPCDSFDQDLKKLLGRRSMEQTAIVEAQRRAAEQRAREEAERQRQAEIAAAETPEEAAEIAQAPIVPLAVRQEAPVRTEGTSFGKQKRVLREKDGIIDAFAMMQWFMSSRERFESLWPEPAKFRAFIEGTVNKALAKNLEIPGIATELDVAVRRSGR